jgi:Asp-tRNA(Asn)/Glu-tRNA(Gln) amidotransferase A subunit family amidase
MTQRLSIGVRRLGCVELLGAYLARVERFNPRLNAIILACMSRRPS